MTVSFDHGENLRSNLITEKICVQIGANLYDFGLFQAWIPAILDNIIKKTGVFLPDM